MNTGIYRAKDLLTELFNQVEFKTVTFGDITQVDTAKQNIYPLAHLTLTSVVTNDTTQNATFEIVVLDWVVKPKLVSAPLVQSNEMDIAHDLNYKIGELQSLFQSDTFQEQITPEQITATFVYGDYENELAGYKFSLTVIIDNAWC